MESANYGGNEVDYFNYILTFFVHAEKNSSSNFTQLSIKVGT